MDWKGYEGRIFKKLQEQFPNKSLKKNVKVDGLASKSKRQVDILVVDSLIGHSIHGVVECKYFNKKVNLPVVDAFVGFLLDVGAHIGIMITNKGASEAARNRAKNHSPSIKIDVVNFANWDEWEIEDDLCHHCDDGGDHGPGFIFFKYFKKRIPIRSGGRRRIIRVDVGECSRCGATHVRCLRCGSIEPVEEEEALCGDSCCVCGWEFCQGESSEKGLCHRINVVEDGKIVCVSEDAFE